VIASQTLAKPEEDPWLFLRFANGHGTRRLSAEDIEAAENTEPGFSLYTAPLSVHDDPYLYMRW
jgi:hypothetical protein